LHDNINQILAAGKLYLDISLAKNGKDLEIMKKSHEHIVLAIEEIRKLSHSLVAPSLGSITLIEAIEALFANIRMATSLELELVIQNFNEEGIDKNINLMFYRIIQEQINNVIKACRGKERVGTIACK
jgi:two-component system sensor histidine kinase UhpB